MFKKIILTFLILILNLFLIDFSLAYSIPVEEVFSDIDSDYKYIHELQTLYDKWMITPDSEWRFNPRKLLNRDEFVWILSEVTCEECIQPDTSYELINKYENKSIFYDINKTNKYFYCISDFTDKWYVSWYYEWTKCDDWTFNDLERPFCANNAIILEEAIAIILRASGILTNEEAEQVRIDIYNWEITENLSIDVSPKNLDWSVYSFYPDIRKALEYEITEVDTDWNIKVSTLIEIIDWKIRPGQSISKEEFLRIAYLTLKANSCEEKQENNLALEMIIYDKECSENNENCNLSDLDDSTNTYDFTNEVFTTCEEWVDDPEWYIWRFYNYLSWEEIKKYWKYIENYEFLSDWKWNVYLRVVDKCWNTWEVFNTININNSGLNVSIEADPIYWEWPLLVDFEWIISGWIWPYTCDWDFWDWNNSYGITPENIYKVEWVYKIELNCIDSNWNIWNATTLIQVIWINDLNTDIDLDWIIDLDDMCPLIPWDIENKWCPILEKKCDINPKCDDGYECNSNNVCLPKTVGESCEYSWWDIIFWNVMCNSCPCINTFDFISTLRKCDVIFPAITSRDSTTIFSKWNFYQIK